MADKAEMKVANLINAEKEATLMAREVRKNIKEDWHLRWALKDRYSTV